MDTTMTNGWTWEIRSSKDKPFSLYCDAFLIFEGREYLVVSGVHVNMNNLALTLGAECAKRNADNWLGLVIEECAA